MSAKFKIISSGVVMLAMFLVGFVPQFVDKRRLQTELEDARTRLSAAQVQIEIDGIRSLAGELLLRASQQNYGIAATRSTELFNKVGALARETNDESLKPSLSALLSARDSITSGLAQGNPSIVPELQALLERTYNIPDAQRIAR